MVECGGRHRNLGFVLVLVIVVDSQITKVEDNEWTMSRDRDLVSRWKVSGCEPRDLWLEFL